MTRQEGVIPSRLLSGGVFRAGLKKLLGRTPQELQILAKLMESGSLEVPDDADPDVAQVVGDVGSLVAFLYDRARSLELLPEGVVTRLKTIGEELDLVVRDDLASALGQLFSPKPLLDERDAIEATKGCVLPTLASVSATQELRNVADLRSRQSLGVIPIVSLGIEFSFPNEDERSISLELDEESLAEFIKSLQAAARELEKLKERVSSHEKILS